MRKQPQKPLLPGTAIHGLVHLVIIMLSHLHLHPQQVLEGRYTTLAEILPLTMLI